MFKRAFLLECEKSDIDITFENIKSYPSILKKVEKLVGHKLPGQVMRAGHRLLSYSMDEVPTAVGA